MNFSADIFKNTVQEPPLQFTGDLMRSFSFQMETVIAGEVQKFHEQGLTVDYVEIAPEDNIFERVESYLGVESHIALANDEFIDEVFTEKLPNLIRRSAFQTIYSTYEIELLKLCQRYETILGGKKLSSLKTAGLAKATDFACHHFPQLENSTEQTLLNEMRKLRNQCIHDDAKAYRKNDIPISEVHNFLSRTSNLIHLSGGNNAGKYIVFEKGSLEFIIDAFETYVMKLDGMVRKRT
ncbi:hypothetical protein VIBNISFn27_240066 [Vibrio nigripulchritudo SFn27]|uniref:Uncharacterized protein n=1 Tax=Vibrio nigripulchritudo TaxID=28173 RepID=U4K218_9VIBR|nr:hypothetical protein [Vibrio nigripulchritudo]CCN81116.1 hypothetical protein VIBNIBLFn1_180001 [Vibrio nigripulchritudo BLFn1]CCN88164.1 hypothetical protein VIBNISFn27_240066 [Vibrio nigripulchritudo SFn27]CCN95580.1 hypothetical protein VIBNIENn2_590065 [Vibrio nigripulchritudo ENn2]CCO41489.1 hypothetical protein VIBNISFn135_520065 [Vibrio nigripulchritudo SFn135]CCO52862.1 hypothetical protein VIBNIWn13_40065 [Vibrio nigripulchritudo Wn13]